MTLLAQSAVFLAAAVCVVPLARRLGLGAVLGYLAAGVLIGPWGARLIAAARCLSRFRMRVGKRRARSGMGGLRDADPLGLPDAISVPAPPIAGPEPWFIVRPRACPTP